VSEARRTTSVRSGSPQQTAQRWSLGAALGLILGNEIDKLASNIALGKVLAQLRPSRRLAKCSD
jgi:hypothetical protein